ncbi:hypothetical protein SUGI_0939350 [Cryptomeria japonica]|nr:hypothetical protein SUGI_0939350 [Cryptomeria japonica]
MFAACSAMVLWHSAEKGVFCLRKRRENILPDNLQENRRGRDGTNAGQIVKAFDYFGSFFKSNHPDYTRPVNAERTQNTVHGVTDIANANAILSRVN